MHAFVFSAHFEYIKSIFAWTIPSYVVHKHSVSSHQMASECEPAAAREERSTGCLATDFPKSRVSRSFEQLLGKWLRSGCSNPDRSLYFPYATSSWNRAKSSFVSDFFSILKRFSEIFERLLHGSIRASGEKIRPHTFITSELDFLKSNSVSVGGCG